MGVYRGGGSDRGDRAFGHLLAHRPEASAVRKELEGRGLEAAGAGAGGGHHDSVVGSLAARLECATAPSF